LEPIPPPNNASTAIIQNKCSRKLATIIQNKCSRKLAMRERERERKQDYL
jgi:hypothetical protein